MTQVKTIWHSALLAATLGVVAPVLADEADAGEGDSPVAEAHTPAHNPDPYEKMNRGIYRFNEKADAYVFKPAAKAYVKVTPKPVKDGIGNFFNNLHEPITVMNQLLQGKFRLAAQDTGRFLINSTVGLLGFIDVASRVPIERHDEDFGQTLGVWGVPSGPYLMLPFLGPSSVRDAAGFGVDVVSNPRRGRLPWKPDLALAGMDALDSRASLLSVEGIIQGDKYLFIRDLYLQRREFVIKDGQVKDEFLDDFDSYDDDSSAHAPAAEGSPASGADSAEGKEEDPFQ